MSKKKTRKTVLDKVIPYQRFIETRIPGDEGRFDGTCAVLRSARCLPPALPAVSESPHWNIVYATAFGMIR